LPALVAGNIHRLDWIEADKSVSAVSSVSGILTLYVLDDWMRPLAIGKYKKASVIAENNLDQIVTEAGDRVMME